jgi:hypothetical protein
MFRLSLRRFVKRKDHHIPEGVSHHQPCGKSDLEYSDQHSRNTQTNVSMPSTPSVACSVASLGKSYLLRGRSLAASHLLGLEVLVQQEQSRLIRLGRSHDGEHPLAGFIMRCLRTVWSAGWSTIHSMGAWEILPTLAIEIRAPEVLRISLILLPARPMIQPTISAGMLIF